MLSTLNTYLDANTLDIEQFFKMELHFLMLFPMNIIFLYESGPMNEYLIKTVDADGLVL